jgi:hypothetical protein
MLGALATTQQRFTIPRGPAMGRGNALPFSAREPQGLHHEPVALRGQKSEFVQALERAHRTTVGVQATAMLPGIGHSLAAVAAIAALSPVYAQLIARSRVSEVLKLYVTDELAEVRSFVEARPYLIELLADAPATIRQIYGECTMKLERLVESEEGWSRLYLVIQTKLGADEIIRRSDRFRDEWILPRIEKFGPDFSVTEEPV